MSNPLRQAKPGKQETLFAARFTPADRDASFQQKANWHVHLTASTLWLSKELAIPLASIKKVAAFHKGRWFVRHALGIEYVNPISGDVERVFLCKLSWIGIYQKEPLLQLAAAIEEARAKVEGCVVQSVQHHAPTTPPEATECEKCGRRPAYYVGYQILCGAVLVWYRTEVTRRVHCKRHLLLVGGGAYLLTALTGWFGTSIFIYPVVVYRSAMSLRPVFGALAYALGILPTLTLAGLIVWFIAFERCPKSLACVSAPVT